MVLEQSEAIQSGCDRNIVEAELLLELNDLRRCVCPCLQSNREGLSSFYVHKLDRVVSRGMFNE